MRKSISLFAGVGGIDCGVAAAGFETAVALDFEATCADSLRANKVGEVLEGDIAGVDVAAVRSLAGLKIGDLDLLTAGPPCQPFSKSANWRHGNPRGLADPRSKPLRHMMRFVEDLLPRVVLIENVPGFAKAGQKRTGGLASVERAFARINERHGVAYRLTSAVVDAADYGVPQHRKRLIMVWDREGRPFSMPAPSHGDGLQPLATSWDAIGRMKVDVAGENLAAKGRWSDLLPSIPEGQNYLWHTDRGGGLPLFGWRTRYWNFLLKLAKDRPAWTLSANPAQNSGPFHWENRLLSVSELARLQTFPDHWEICGGRIHQVRQLGNAVPPLLAEVFGRQIRRQLLGDRPKAETKLGIGVRKALPAPEPVKRVHPKYLDLQGAHDDHPGHGKGPGAQRRIADGLKAAA